MYLRLKVTAWNLVYEEALHLRPPVFQEFIMLPTQQTVFTEQTASQGNALSCNPFNRSFGVYRIQRMLAIVEDKNLPYIFRALHQKSEGLSDHYLVECGCYYTDEWAYVPRELSNLSEIIDECDWGEVAQVIYRVVATYENKTVDIADTNSHGEAQTLIQRLGFSTGTYSKCWEISNAHLQDSDIRFLQDLAGKTTDTDLYFEVFELPESNAVGVKLHSTPWDDGIVSEAVQRINSTESGVSSTLGNVLLLAAAADIRILIFDPAAVVLPELPVFDW